MEPSRPPPPGSQVTAHLRLSCALPTLALDAASFSSHKLVVCGGPAEALGPDWSFTLGSWPAGDSRGVGPGEYRLGDQAAAPWGSSRLAPSSAPTVEWVWTWRARCPLVLETSAKG